MNTTATNARPSTCTETPGAYDVDVTVTIPGAVTHCCSECGGPVDDDGSRDCGHDVADVVSVVVRPARTVSGEVTLAPQQYDGRLAAYGASPDMWISGGLLQALRAVDDGDFREACREIVDTASEACA